MIIRSNTTTDGSANKNKSQLLVPINSVALTEFSVDKTGLIIFALFISQVIGNESQDSCKTLYGINITLKQIS